MSVFYPGQHRRARPGGREHDPHTPAIKTVVISSQRQWTGTCLIPQKASLNIKQNWRQPLADLRVQQREKEIVWEILRDNR